LFSVSSRIKGFLMSKLVESLEGRQLMSASGNDASNPILTVSETTLSFTRAGEYTFELVPSRQAKVKVQLDGGHSTMLPKAQFDAITKFQIGQGATVSVDVTELPGLTIAGAGTLNVTGVTFTEADAAADSKFEPSYNFDSLM
jgi:hypothetical protein